MQNTKQVDRGILLIVERMLYVGCMPVNKSAFDKKYISFNTIKSVTTKSCITTGPHEWRRGLRHCIAVLEVLL